MSSQLQNAISFKKETTWGTAVIPDKSLPVRFTGGITTDIDTQDVSNVYGGRIAKVTDKAIGARTHEGEYECDLFCDYTAYFLASALGGVSSALKGGESVVYNHTLTESVSKPSLTIEQAIQDNVRRFAGSIVTGFKVEAKAGEIATLSFGVKAKSQATATAISPAYTTQRPLNFADFVVSIGGSAVAQVVSLEVEYKNNVEMLHALGANDPSYNYVKPSEISGKLELYLDSTTTAYMTDYLAKTERSLQIVGTGQSIGTSSNDKFDLTIHKAVFTAAETTISDEYNLLVIEFEGKYDTATSKLLTLILTNLLANLN